MAGCRNSWVCLFPVSIKRFHKKKRTETSRGVQMFLSYRNLLFSIKMGVFWCRIDWTQPKNQPSRYILRTNKTGLDLVIDCWFILCGASLFCWHGHLNHYDFGIWNAMVTVTSLKFLPSKKTSLNLLRLFRIERDDAQTTNIRKGTPMEPESKRVFSRTVRTTKGNGPLVGQPFQSRCAGCRGERCHVQRKSHAFSCPHGNNFLEVCQVRFV